MKTRTQMIAIVFLVFIFGVSLSFAGFRLPNHVFRMNQLERAQEKAREYNKPITFVYTNENTDCGLATSASLDAFEILESQTIVVYVGRGDWDKVPPVVKRAINSAEAGEYIPSTVIVNPDMSEVISIVPYIRNVQKRKQTLREVSRTVSY